MKLLLFLIAVTFLFAPTASAQDAMLTKEETVNYIHKKLQELVGKVEKLGGNSKFTALSFTLKDDKIEYVVNREKKVEGKTINEKVIQVFNPAHMIDGDAAVYLCGIGGSICLKFPEKLAKQTKSWDSFSWAPTEYDAVIIEFDPKIPDMKNHLMKAFRHLHDLAKAEDDPFSSL